MKQVLDKSLKMSRSGNPQRGAVVVELALMLPFLILVFLVVADLGLLLREHQVLENAAREGARFSSLLKNSLELTPSASLGAIQQHVVDYCAQEGIAISTGDVTVNQGASFQASGRTVKASEVTVSVSRELFLPSTLFFDSTSVELTGRAVIRNFY